MRRELINPMIVYVLPVSILFFLIFAVLLLTSLDSTLMDRFGFNASASIGAYGTFFFIAVLEHVSLRDAVQSSTLVYFEWFYIVLYVLLLLLSLNALLFATNHQIPLVDQRDNLWPKVLYWPVSSGLMCAVTLYTLLLTIERLTTGGMIGFPWSRGAHRGPFAPATLGCGQRRSGNAWLARGIRAEQRVWIAPLTKPCLDKVEHLFHFHLTSRPRASTQR